MAFYCYKPKNFSPDHTNIIAMASTILEGYNTPLTVRQLYYQFVARDLIPNTQAEYKRLGGIIKDGRLAGLIDWDAIEDRGRVLHGTVHHADPKSCIEDAAEGFHLDHSEGQPNRVEVWVEKQALEGVIAEACVPLDVDYFSTKGYNSTTAMRAASERFDGYIENGQNVVLLYLGDHDPSGFGISQDIDAQLNDLFASDVQFQRIALSMAQVSEFRPPPNYAKVKDSRSRDYIAEHGDQSWELDALAPDYLVEIIKEAVHEYRDLDLWQTVEDRQQEQRQELVKLAENFA